MGNKQTGNKQTGNEQAGNKQTDNMGTDNEAAMQTGSLLQNTKDWGLGFSKKEGEKPKGNASIEEMQAQGAYYMAPGEEKVLYLTFDCGFENGNTCAILDALKKHNAPATFFVVGHYLESAPDLVKRMVEEGHTVGNHTYHHYDMSKIADKSIFEKEMKDVATLYEQITGQKMAMYYRPPQGKYSQANLKMAKELGYSTFFWSLAYVDWQQDSQPSCEEAMRKLTQRVHPGAVVLLHNTSQTNGQIIDRILTEWEKMGYTFRPLADFLEEELRDEKINEGKENEESPLRHAA
jgi:peptidoglycan-N-acetylmuramic acid deacetylase